MPPEVTIASERRWYAFLRDPDLEQVREAVVIDAAAGTEDTPAEDTRWYKDNGSTLRLLHRLVSGKATTPAKATGVRLAWTSARPDPSQPRHGPLRRRGPQGHQLHPGAHRSTPPCSRTTARRGRPSSGACSPSPRTEGPSLGTSVAVSTWLWDWSRYPTLGTLTGPQAGILVVDVERRPVEKGRGQEQLAVLANRCDGLTEGGLVSCRGEATPERVRRVGPGAS